MRYNRRALRLHVVPIDVMRNANYTRVLVCWKPFEEMNCNGQRNNNNGELGKNCPSFVTNEFIGSLPYPDINDKVIASEEKPNNFFGVAIWGWIEGGNPNTPNNTAQHTINPVGHR